MIDIEGIEDVRLSSNVTVKDYVDYKRTANKKEIVKFIRDRFSERYIQPIKDKKVSGFTIMALSCLMIEALESFRNGWKDTNRKSKKAFESFFEYTKQNNLKLGVFHDVADDFYKNVRCGLLHQAETRNGWRILKKGKLYDEKAKSINADEFLNGIEEYLDYYCRKLEEANWNDDIWVNLRKKMIAIIENCKKR